MKREILFRAKRSDTGEWVYGDLAHSEGSTVIIEENGVYNDGSASPFFAKWDFVDKNTVCQFTGLYDKDGREIYDGDIVRDDTCGDCNNIFCVEWFVDDSCWLLMNKKADTARRFLENRRSWYTVVGNIHDNPELLEGGKP